MKFTFVNHASFIVETDDIVLLCDPWLDGMAFNDGWALTSPSRLDHEKLKTVTHIWFSHEHPDHFAPSSLKGIPPEIRGNIGVLFQATEDRRVVQFCSKLGFQSVEEMHPDQWLNLSTSVKVLCNPQKDEWQGDSWLCLKSTDGCLLNVNDCGIYSEAAARKIAEKTGPVDLLCTQFSYAAWQGNADALEEHRRQAARALEHIRTQAKVFQPRYILPFASFVWFCHEENFFLNAGMNRIDAAAEWIATETSAAPVVLYPGDNWELGAAHEWKEAAARYNEDIEEILAHPQLQVSKPVDESKLIGDAEQFIKRCYKSSSQFLVQMYMAMESYREKRRINLSSPLKDLIDLAMLKVEPARIYVTDLNKAYEFSLPNGLKPIQAPEQSCDIALSAESLQHCLLIDWGGETLLINGRFQEPHAHGRPVLSRGAQSGRWFKFTDLARRINMGFRLDWDVAREALAWRVKTLFGMSKRPNAG